MVHESGESGPRFQTSQERERAWMNAIPDLMFVLDRDGVYLDYHAADLHQLLAPPDQFLGKKIDEVVPSQIAERLMASLARVLQTGRVESLEYSLTLDGELRTYEARVAPCSDGQVLVMARDITARKRIEADLRAQEQLFENLVAVARATTEQPTLQATLQNALEIVMALTGATDGDLNLLDSSGMVTHSILPSGPANAEQRENYVAHVMDRGLAGWVFRHGEAALIEDTLADERWLMLPDARYHFRSALSVPVMSRSALAGILTLAHPQPGHFSGQHLRLIKAAADEIALAVRNAQLFDEQRRMTERQTTLYQVLQAVSGLHDPETVARLAVEAIVKFTGWPNAAVITPNEENTHWVVCAASGYLVRAAGMTRPLDQGIVGRVFKTGQRQCVPDVSADPDYVASHPNTHSELVVPLRRSQAVSGVLTVDSDRVAAFDADDVALAESLADVIALGLLNATLYAQTQRHAADMSALYAITRMTSRSLAMEEVLEQALASAITLLGFGAGLIALAEPDQVGPYGHALRGDLRLAASRGLPADLVEGWRRDGLQDTLSGYVFRQRESLVIKDSQQSVPPQVGNAADQMKRLGYRAYAGIPLLHQGQPLGVMSLVAREARTSSAYDLALLGTIGQQIAGAVANARLFQAALAGQSRSQALINSSRDGIVLIGLNGRILILNAPALRLLRLAGQPQEWLGRSLQEALPLLRVVAPAAFQAVTRERRRMRQALSSATPHTSSGEGEIAVPPHMVRWVSLPVMTGSLPQGQLIVLYDVTDERALERLQEDMTHTMVHDLRNPLGSIYGALDMIAEGMLGDVSPDQLEVLQIAQRSAHRMLGLVNAILDVSRLESGRMPLEQRALSLADLVSEALLQSQVAQAGDKHIHLESQISSELPLAWADANLIARVLQNLIDNAIKFTPPHGTISVTAARREAEQPESTKLLVQVRDSGAGIPPDIKSRLFQKFVSGQQPERGSGLGLAFCKLAIEAHGERIWVENEPGQGATFTFSLAVARPNA